MLRTYLDRRQETVAEWVALWPIFDVCVREMGNEGGGILWVPWWRQEASENQLRVTVESILGLERLRHQQEIGRRGGSKEGSERVRMDSKR